MEKTGAVARRQQYGKEQDVAIGSHSQYRKMMMDLQLDDGRQFRSFARSIDDDNESLSFSLLVAAIDNALSIIQEGIGSTTEKSPNTEEFLGLGLNSNLGATNDYQDMKPPSFGPRTKNKLMSSWESLPEDEPDILPSTIDYKTCFTSMESLTGSMKKESLDQLKPIQRFHTDGVDCLPSSKPPPSVRQVSTKREFRRAQSSRRRFNRLGDLSKAQSFRFHQQQPVPTVELFGRHASAPQERTAHLHILNNHHVKNLVQIPTPSGAGEEICSIVKVPNSTKLAPSVTFSDNVKDIKVPELENPKEQITGSGRTPNRRPSQGSQSSMGPPLRETDLTTSSRLLSVGEAEVAPTVGDENIASDGMPTLLSRDENEGSKAPVLESRPEVDDNSMKTLVELGEGSKLEPGFLRYQSSTEYSLSVKSDKQRFWEAEVAELEAQLDECEAEIDMLDDEVMRSKQKNRELTEEFQKKRRALIKLEERFGLLKVEIARARSVEDDLEIHMVQTVMERDLQIVNLTNEINQLSIDHTKLRRAYTAVCKNLTTTESNLARVESREARNKATSESLFPSDFYIVRSTM